MCVKVLRMSGVYKDAMNVWQGAISDVWQGAICDVWQGAMGDWWK